MTMLLSGPDGPLLVSPTHATTSRAEVEARAHELARIHEPTLRGRVLGLRGRATPESLAWLIATTVMGTGAALLPLDGSADAALELWGIAGERAGPERPSEDPADAHLVLFTSGTTGQPKAARHDWARLVAAVHRGPSTQGARWLLGYPMSAFAGMQVTLHALLGGGTLCVPTHVPAPDQLAWASEVGVTHLSATPTFFRIALAMGPPLHERWSPEQITLGGEAVDQGILDQLRARFPMARITHIYASTELGPCFSVHDGQAGFPTAFLERETRGVWMTVRDGELHVRSRHAMQGYVGQSLAEDALVPTGDLVRIDGDRVRFLGRKGERLSVGGAKVDPAEVEQVVLEVTGVAAARVSGVPSPLVGQLVKVEVVAAPTTDHTTVREAVQAHCRARLDRHKWPRIVRFVDELAQTRTGKIARVQEVPCP